MLYKKNESVKQLVSVVVVNYNSKNYLKKLIDSFIYIKRIIGEIIIIDNNSKHGIDDLFINSKYKVKIINNKTNYGFAHAVNQGIDESTYKYILLLNPDTELINTTPISLLKQLAKNQKIGVIGGKILHSFGNKTIYFSANSKPSFFTCLFDFTNLKKIFPNNPFTNNFWIEKRGEPNKSIPVDSLCGAFILFRKTINKQIVKFDDNYFLYLEDLDFCLKLREQGTSILFDPNVVIKHRGGGSNRSRYHIVSKHWYNSRKYFVQKHFNFMQSHLLICFFNAEEKFLKIFHNLKNEPFE